MAGLGCAFPAEIMAIYELQKAGRILEALDIYRWFMPLLELVIDPKLVQNIKLAEVHAQIGSEHVRAPRLPLASKCREKAIRIINDALATSPQLPDYLELQKMCSPLDF